ncbi:unnamed protein product [Spirodela intermedia]|uniref:Uncharacterized protein n=1 Tax=Spirodela intermedia TaxID=51605 RepID=A0A7I8L399_SPIIN|nr:unnamed protein product [Spirodela intermedia]
MKRPRLRSFPSPSEELGCYKAQDLIGNLPDECISHVFSFLPSHSDRCSCAAVSRRWLLLQALQATPAAAGDDGAATRRFHSHKANDARLAAMAVGSCWRRAPTEIFIRASSMEAPGVSSLMAVTDLGLAIISHACPSLRSLSLWNCVLIGDEGLAAVAGGCPELEKLDVSNAPKLGDGGLIAVAAGCRRLSMLRLEMCPGVGDGALRAFAEFSLNLESIAIGSCPLVGDAGFVSVFSSSLPKLSKVRIVDAAVGDGALAAIGDRGERTALGFLSLSLDNVWGFTHLGFRRLAMAATLRSLELRSCRGLTDACFFATGGESAAAARREAAFVGLRNLTLRRSSLTDGGLVRLSETAEKLESLELEKCHEVTTEGLMAAVRSWSRSLRALSLVKCNGVGGAPLGGRGMVPGRCPLLRSLTINGCPRVGDEFLSSLGRELVRPKRMALVGLCSVTDGGFVSLMAAMQRRDGLRSVDLSGCRRITDWSVAALVSGASEALKRLALEGCDGVTDRSLRLIGLLCPALVELDLSRCKRIGDGGVAGLLASSSTAAAGPSCRSGSRLEVLSLEGCSGITDESLGSLEEMALRGNLAGLNLKHCGGLSAAAVDSVRRTLWWCDLIS